MINKQGWEIKKLGDICIIERGGSPRPINQYITHDQNGINWIKIGDTEANSKYITKTKEKIIPEGMSKSRYVQRGDFLLSNSMSFGRPYILNINGCIHDGWLVIKDTNGQFNKHFLFFLLSAPATYLKFKSLAVGGVVNNLNTKLVSNLYVPIPPLSIQNQIVKELDTLQAIITKKKAQLDELDTLAQATFYDMFGDPVENDKGWDVHLWSEILKIYNGKNQKKIEDAKGKYPICGSGGIMGYGNNFICPENTVILGRKGNINKPIFMRERFWNVDTAFGLVADIKYIAPLFLFYFCKNYNFEKHNKAVTIPSLTKTDLLKIEMPTPPLYLQNQFAQRIEAIEKQKALINQSIAETQLLFDSAMDNYFN